MKNEITKEEFDLLSKFSKNVFVINPVTGDTEEWAYFPYWFKRILGICCSVVGFDTLPKYVKEELARLSGEKVVLNEFPLFKDGDNCRLKRDRTVKLNVIRRVGFSDLLEYGKEMYYCEVDNPGWEGRYRHIFMGKEMEYDA